MRKLKVLKNKDLELLVEEVNSILANLDQEENISTLVSDVIFVPEGDYQDPFWYINIWVNDGSW